MLLSSFASYFFPLVVALRPFVTALIAPALTNAFFAGVSLRVLMSVLPGVASVFILARIASIMSLSISRWGWGCILTMGEGMDLDKKLLRDVSKFVGDLLSKGVEFC